MGSNRFSVPPSNYPIISFSADEASQVKSNRNIEQSNSWAESVVLEIEAREAELPGQGKKVL